ncbi:hypothetical protein AN958_12372 [Leucoagaricus sp. SymC.cos]|nr:hypothetical protein AN958_12372 [Leucoagaricus sp. SymC.cos]
MSLIPGLARVTNPFTRLLAQTVNTPGIEPGDKGVLDSGSHTSSNLSTSSGSDSESGDESTGTTLSRVSSSSPSSSEEIFHSAYNGPRLSAGPLAVGGLRITTSNTLSSGPGIGTVSGQNNENEDSVESDLPVGIGRFDGIRDSRNLAHPARKRKDPPLPLTTSISDSDNDGGSDLRGPSKKLKSIPGTVERSFEVRLKRETLNFDLPSSRPTQPVGHNAIGVGANAFAASSSAVLPPATTVAGAVAGSAAVPVRPARDVLFTAASFDGFLERIKQVAPDLRLPFGLAEPHSVARILGMAGNLTTGLLWVLGMSDVQELSLGPSLQDHNGLNIRTIEPRDFFRELHGHGLFKCLTRLSCDNVPLKDDSIVHLHGLQLQHLSLIGTGIPNAAVFVLVPLRETLQSLWISANPALDNDAVPAVMMLKKLDHLALDGTSVDIEGLRRLAETFHTNHRKVRVDIPQYCCHYMEYMPRLYLVDIPPYLVSEVDGIYRLQLVDLRRNLAAHSAVNRSILTTGNKGELRDRLRQLLVKRKRDLMVKKMWKEGQQMRDVIEYSAGSEGSRGRAGGIGVEDDDDNDV